MKSLNCESELLSRTGPQVVVEAIRHMTESLFCGILLLTAQREGERLHHCIDSGRIRIRKLAHVMHIPDTAWWLI